MAGLLGSAIDGLSEQYSWIQEYQTYYTEHGLTETLSKITADLGSDFSETFYKYLNITTPGENLPQDYTLNQSKYDFRSMVFPEDVGVQGSYNGHYMVININAMDDTNFGSVTRSTGLTSGESTLGFTKLPGELSKVDALRSNIDRTYRTGGHSLAQPVFVPRRTRRIKESIALYMPNTLYFTTRNSYDDVGLTEMAFRAVQTVADMAPGPVGRMVQAGQQLLPQVGQLNQQPLNPRVEVLFNTTHLREFQFDFLMAPTTRAESAALETIIKTLRFHAAPEYNPLTSGLSSYKALLWVPPSEFDITFFNRSRENMSIPRINTCVLQNIDVDYAPSGVYSTFSNGSPVQVRLQLNFREVEVVHKLRVMQGF